METEKVPESDESVQASYESPGQMLRQAREEQGLTQQQIADKLYLRIKNIVAIEEDVLDENTSVTFIKGYVRLYAKHVGLAEPDILAAFERYHSAPKQPAKLQSFSRRVAKQAHDDRWMMVTYIIGLVLIAAVVLWWYQQETNPVEDEVQSQIQVPTSNTSQSSPQATLRVEKVPTTQAATVEDSSNTPDSPASDTQNDANIDGVNDTLTDTASDTVDVLAGTSTTDEDESQSDSQAAPVELVFTFADECWMNLQDATGEAIAYGVKKAGRVMPVSGIPPFDVTLGAPQVVSITIDGEAVDMSGFTGGQIARFTLPMQE
jgi:cytoskeleton protein RodZ